MKFSRLTLPIAIVAIAGAAVSECSACSVPVFRYALEQWAPDDYRLILFHSGELKEGDQALVDRLLAPVGEHEAEANFQLLRADIEGDLESDVAAAWKSLGRESLDRPLLALLTPLRHGPASIAWTADLEKTNIDLLLDSPARREVASRLLDGHSVVWVLLECGQKEKDDAAYETLQSELKRLERVLELPELAAEDAAALSIESGEMKLAFSAMRLSRDAEEERLFVETLLRVEPDLKDDDFAQMPMVFPVFGRGRALYALVGEGISSILIEEAGRFLTGACQCTVKAQNPGADLLMAVNWDRLVVPTLEEDTELPPLAGLTGFVSDETQLAQADAEKEAPAGDEPQSDVDESAASDTDGQEAEDVQATAKAKTDPVTDPEAGSAISFNVLVSVIVVGLIVVVAGAILSRRMRGER